MRRTRLAATVRVAALISPLLLGACLPRTPLPPVVPGSGPGLFVSGYHPWWAGDGWRDYPLVDLDRLYLFEVELTSDGSPGDSHGWPERWSPLLERAGEVGLSVVPVVTLHPESAVPTLLSDAGAVARAVETVVRVATAHPSVRGVHLDLEVFQQVPPEARAGYVALVEGVRSRVREMAPGSVVSVFVPALDFADAYDEAALARAADYLVVQGYDLHHRTGARAGPLGALRGWAPLDWETVVDRFAALEIPDERLVMGIPLYGYEWPVEGPEVGSPTRGEGVITPLVAAPDVLPALPRALDRIREHGHRRDPASDVPWYAFSTPEGWFQGWYDDAVSVRAKIDFVRRRGLGGVAFFPLAYSTPEIREMIRGAGRR